MNKPVYLGLSVLEISKTLSYEFIKATQNYPTWIPIVLLFILKMRMFMKIFQMIIKKRFDTSNHEVNRSLPTRKKKKVIGLMKDGLGGKLMTLFVALRGKIYFY